MLLASLMHDLEAYIVIFIIVLLSATLWYDIHFFRPYAKFPAWRLEFRLPYWLLNRQNLDIVILEKEIEQSRKYEAEGLFVLWFFKPLVIVYGEENVKSLLPYATEKSPLMKIYEFMFGKGLFVSNGQRWKSLKKIIAPAFHTQALRSYVPFMNNNARALVQKLSEKKGDTVLSISHTLAECTLRLFYESSLGVREGQVLEVKKTRKVVQKIVEFAIARLFRPWLFFDFLLPFFPYASYILKLEEEHRKTTAQILEQIKESMRAPEQSQANDEQFDILSKRPKTIGENILEGCPSISINEMAKEINGLAFAGFDTTAHALMWVLYSLGLNPEIQDRVYDEIATLTEGDIQYTDVQDLTYLGCVIKESARMYTPPFIARRVKEDVQCGNYKIPKNTDVTFLTFTLHRNPDIYPDPEKFDPDRFMDSNSKIKPWNYIPFAEGPRPCIGKNYAMLSMKIFLIHILREFKVISLDRREDLTFKWGLVLSAEKDPRMRFIPRHKHISNHANLIGCDDD